MEIEIIPTRFVMAFDSLNKLAESEHANAYIRSFSMMLNSIREFVKGDASIEVPASVINADNSGQVPKVQSRMLFSDFCSDAYRMGQILYSLDEFEVMLLIHIGDERFCLKCNSDPVVFTFEACKKKAKGSFF